MSMWYALEDIHNSLTSRGIKGCLITYHSTLTRMMECSELLTLAHFSQIPRLCSIEYYDNLCIMNWKASK
jgi:hypothetical protein